MFQAARREYNFAIHAVATGQYRHAFMSLRLHFELSLAGIFFSSEEIRLRRWIKGQEDIIWNRLVDKEQGVFSTNFVSSFNEGLKSYGLQYGSLAQAVYRECSEFVHGNVSTLDKGDEGIKLLPELLSKWCESADTMRLCIVFAFASRHLQFLDKAGIQVVDETFREVLGHLPEVRYQLDTGTVQS